MNTYRPRLETGHNPLIVTTANDSINVWMLTFIDFFIHHVERWLGERGRGEKGGKREGGESGKRKGGGGGEEGGGKATSVVYAVVYDSSATYNTAKYNFHGPARSMADPLQGFWWCGPIGVKTSQCLPTIMLRDAG